jgi:hypothetical protein
VAVVKVTVTVPLCSGTFWVTVMLAAVTWPPRGPEAMAVLGLSFVDDTVTSVAPAVGTPVVRVSNLHTFWALSHAVLVVVMTKLLELITTLPAVPVPPVHDMVGTAPEVAIKKLGGKLMVIAAVEAGAPVGSVKVTVTA